MGMTNEEREKHIRIANMLIGAINDLIRPILMYQIEMDITREALENYIKMLEQQPCEDVEEYGMNEQMESSSEKPNKSENPTSWISVSERLPEEGKSVLVCFKAQGGMAQSVSERFDGDSWSALCGMEPIAWMPLPEPYQSND